MCRPTTVPPIGPIAARASAACRSLTMASRCPTAPAGGGWFSAFLHQARTVCRRAERLVTTLARQEAVGTHALIYLNRLSDLLFVLGRWAAKTRQEPEPLWNPTKT